MDPVQQPVDTAVTTPAAPAAPSPAHLVAAAEEFRKFVETEVLQIIKELAEKTDVPNERIQAIAKITLDSLKPGMALDELYMQAVKLDDNYSELGPLVVKIMSTYENKYSKTALSFVSHLIKEGKYDDAQNMVKKVLQFQIFK